MVLNTYDNYSYPIMRADVIRYFFLYHYGGLYLDMDIAPNSDFGHLFSSNADIYLAYTPNGNSFTNCIIASKAKAKFWLHVFETLQKRSDWWIPNHHFSVIFKTG